MKLVLCLKCQDIIRLQGRTRRCKCEASGGRYTDDLNAEYWGADAVPLGFDNVSLARAVRLRPTSAGLGTVFEAFVIPEDCKTMEKVDHKIKIRWKTTRKKG